MASEDIRKILNLLESAETPESIDEAVELLGEDFLSEGWLTNFSNKMKRKMGQRELAKLSKRLNDEWHTWLGQVSRTGDLDDMKRFMKMRVGFNDKDIEQVLNDPNSPVKQQDASSPEDEKATNQSIKTGHELNGGDSTEAPEAPVEKPSEPQATSEPQSSAEPEAEKKDDGGFGDAIRAAQAKARERRTRASATAPQSEPADEKREPGEVIDDPENYMTATGKLDPKKINDKLRSMPIGDKLTLGKRTFFLTPKDDSAKKESIQEAGEATDEKDKPLSNKEVGEILHLSASHINDEYLLNGPTNDEYYDRRDKTNFAAQSGSGNPGGPKPSGQYDPKELWDVLAANGFSKNRFKTLEQKVAGSKSVGDMSNDDMRQMALIGYALLRSRT
jgi:hypothetical protein